MPTIATKIQTHLVGIVAFVAIMKICNDKDKSYRHKLKRKNISVSEQIYSGTYRLKMAQKYSFLTNNILIDSKGD